MTLSVRAREDGGPRRCLLCHDTVEDGSAEAAACSSCGTLYHVECAGEIGGACAVLGCGAPVALPGTAPVAEEARAATPVVVPQPQVAARPWLTPELESRIVFIGCALGFAFMVATAIVGSIVVPEQRSRVVGSCAIGAAVSFFGMIMSRLEAPRRETGARRRRR